MKNLLTILLTLAFSVTAFASTVTDKVTTTEETVIQEIDPTTNKTVEVKKEKIEVKK